MKKLLSIVVLAVVTLASMSVEAIVKKPHNTGRHCCFPCVFNGAGTTELGQLVNPDGTSLNNLGFLGLNAQNYSRVKKCPIFKYNGKDPVTGEPFEQGSAAGISQTIEGVTLFGGTLCLPDESDLCQNGGDLLNFPVVMDATVVISNNGNISAINLAIAFSGGAFGQEAFVRADRSGTTSFLTEYLFNSLKGENDEWCIGDQNVCFGCGPFTEEEWAAAFPNGSASRITSVTGAEAMMQAVEGSQEVAFGYIGWRDFQVLNSTGNFPNVNVVGIQSSSDPTFLTPSSASIGNQLGILGSVPANLLISTIGSSKQGDVNTDLKEAYPMASPANVVVRCCQFSKCQVIELRKFLYYLVTVGQGNAEQFGLVPLSPAIIKQYLKNLNLLQHFEDCVSCEVFKCCEC